MRYINLRFANLLTYSLSPVSASTFWPRPLGQNVETKRLALNRLEATLRGQILASAQPLIKNFSISLVALSSASVSTF